MGKPASLEGQKFNRWTVIEKVGMTKHNKVLWRCRCDCGNESTVWTQALTSGHSKSCGCLKIELLTKHGKLNTKIWQVWKGMKRRCKDKSFSSYKNYGGRGVTYCKEWENFIPFYEWSIENGYKEGLSLDRIDNNGNYEPSNCRWATRAVQNRNKRSNIYITYNGETKILRDWEKYFGMNKGTLRARINQYGWSIEKAFNTPVNRRYSYSGVDGTSAKGSE